MDAQRHHTCLACRARRTAGYSVVPVCSINQEQHTQLLLVRRGSIRVPSHKANTSGKSCTEEIVNAPPGNYLIQFTQQKIDAIFTCTSAEASLQVNNLWSPGWSPDSSLQHEGQYRTIKTTQTVKREPQSLHFTSLAGLSSFEAKQMENMCSDWRGQRSKEPRHNVSSQLLCPGCTRCNIENHRRND